MSTGKKLYKVTKVIDFCYGHRLLNYSGKCRHVHGHNGLVEIEVASEELDELGMVIDFSEVKRIVKNWIDENLDHRMILHKNDPAVEYLRTNDEPMYLLDVNPTAEVIAELIYSFAKGQGLPVVEVRLWETLSSFASYREGTNG